MIKKATYNATLFNNVTWDFYATINLSPGVPFDLSAYTGQSQIRSHDGTIVASPVVTITDPANGKIWVHVSLAQARGLPLTDCVDKTKGLDWDVVFSTADQGKVFCLVEGKIQVRAGVTQWA
jgi:hypothetical protein